MDTKNETKYILVVAAVIHRGSNSGLEVAIFRRGPGSAGSGHYEFPGGKVEPGESDEVALRREIAEELGVVVEVGPLIGETYYSYPAKNIHLKFFWVKDPGQSFVLSEHDDHRWVRVQDIDVSILSEGDREIVQTLRAAPLVTTKG